MLLRDVVAGFEGKWVALKGRRVVEVGGTAEAVYTALRDSGVAGATIMRVPAIGEPELLGLG
ncbi:MAG: DUF5678 domain-containing protein [Acidimicrobiales bacterium]